jgi:carbamoyl-phosphate synthase large subunit
VAPAQTLTDKEYQVMRNASVDVLRAIGVETGGSNVQFAINPLDGRMVVIEMNPRVSRSSALASKATGFPIARVATKLAIGYTLPELENEITGGATPASFEPTIDYIVTKIPRFTFEKFPQAENHLTTQMKSVGEVMALGRTFKESLQKALRGLEIGINGFSPKPHDSSSEAMAGIRHHLSVPGAERMLYIGEAFRSGLLLSEIKELTGIDEWFLAQIEALIASESSLVGQSIEALDAAAWLDLKRDGFSDARLAELLSTSEQGVRDRRLALGVKPVYKRVDSCAAEFAATTAYMYSTYEQFCEAEPSDREKIMVLGGGPNRIGQGIEFDYCCVHAALAMREDGYETIMVNCNPETVSTDFDTSDRLYFEPLTLEDVLAIADIEKPKGVIVQFGGQTPLKLARALEAAGVAIIGTSPDAIDAAEDRERFQQMLNHLGLTQPANKIVRNVDEGIQAAEEIGYPLVVRPSYVLGGRAMEIVYQPSELLSYLKEAVVVTPDSPVLLDRFLDQAIEVDVDAVSDGKQVVIGAIMEHIEQAGVHSGDSACSLPPYSLSETLIAEIERQVDALARALKVVGLMNVQCAIQGEQIYVLEVNPRASRTVPFVSKCMGRSLAKIAARCMAGMSLADQGFTQTIHPELFHVKEAVFPFNKFPGVDPILGPEMKSTGEVMGIGRTFGEAYGKSQWGANDPIPERGRALLSVRDPDKSQLVPLAKDLLELGFKLCATRGSAKIIAEAGLPVDRINKVVEGRPDITDGIKNHEIDLIINTTEGKQAIADSFAIRRTALQNNVYYTTTMAGGRAVISALRHREEIEVYCLQEMHKSLATSA